MAVSQRTLRILWAAACVLLVFAMRANFRAHSHESTMSWANDKVTGLLRNKGGREPLRDFMARSEATWAKTVKQRHDMIAADYSDISEMPLFPAVGGDDSYWKHPYSIWDFAPASYNCPWDVERIGRMGDGGKWVCGMSRYENYPSDRECVIYSFGVRDESSFEEELLQRTNCNVWAYDFSVVDFGKQVTAANRDRAHFSQIGIGKTDLAKDPPFYSIKDLMAKNGHTYVDILKMDIEFAEFEALEDLVKDFPAPRNVPVGQIMVEIHLFGGKPSSKEFLEWWERLEDRGLRASWTEPNLLAVTLNAQGKDPIMAEYTLVNVHDEKNILFQDR